VLGRGLKIRIDENIANRVARAVVAIAENRGGYEVSFVKHGDGSVDPAWIKKFADEGGTAIVSGDHKILQHWPNLIAYSESGLISFFPPSEFAELKAFAKAAFIIRWWPAIIEKIKLSNPGDRWRLPMVWQSADHTKMIAIKDPRIDNPPAEPEDTSKAEQGHLEIDDPAAG
jgi:hypothetical protein